ncbi:MAG: hypothetical protein BRD57_01570 [Proteobacteria bacterium SW_6_67_9]|nr:MAG: hypothetical protein BRD57_01570 [Proteobacteria bacterium SW_6_67_9]
MGVSGVVAAGVQLVCVVALAPAALPVLVVAWAYFALMSVEFFAPRRLAARPALYLLSHAVITPLIAAVCAAFVGGAASGVDVAWLLAASLFGSLVIEIGRKLRAPSAEQPGVETYTKLWGRQWAVSAWLAALIGAAGCAVAEGRQRHELSCALLAAAGAVRLGRRAGQPVLQAAAPALGGTRVDEAQERARPGDVEPGGEGVRLPRRQLRRRGFLGAAGRGRRERVPVAAQARGVSTNQTGTGKPLLERASSAAALPPICGRPASSPGHAM